MNTAQLNDICSLYSVEIKPFFRGVFARDSFLSSWKEYLNPDSLNLYIVNSQLSTDSGKHWLLFGRKTDKWIFFDSFGKDFSFYEIPGISAEAVSPYRVQGSSNICGIYCMFIAEKLSQDRKLEQIINHYFDSSELLENDLIVRDWFLCRGYNKVLNLCTENSCITYQDLIKTNHGICW